MSEHLKNPAVECEFHQSRLFALGKSRTDLSYFVHRWQQGDCLFGIFTFSFKTLRYFSSGPWPICTSTRLLIPLLLNLSLVEVTSKQQYVLLHRHNISVHLNSSLKKPGSLLSCCLCFTKHVLGKKFATASAVKLSTQSFDRNLFHCALISGLVQSCSSF